MFDGTVYDCQSGQLPEKPIMLLDTLQEHATTQLNPDLHPNCSRFGDFWWFTDKNDSVSDNPDYPWKGNVLTIDSDFELWVEDETFTKNGDNINFDQDGNYFTAEIDLRDKDNPLYYCKLALQWKPIKSYL